MVDFVLFVWHLRIYELYNDSECFFSEESMGDIEKRTRSHDLWSLRLTGLEKSKHALHDAAIRNSPQWGEIKNTAD